MARTIDEKIVQMTFNNDNFEKNAKQTISTLDKLKESLDLTKASKNFNDLEKTAKGLDLSSITIATTKISEGFSVLEEIAVGALRRIGEMALNTGAQLVKSMTVDSFMASWGKYDQMIAAQQKIMSSVAGKTNPLTGEIYDLDAVLERINKLRWYSDETSYSIDQMSNAIGNFTASGVDLDVATTAILGIANAAGDAGVGAAQAESAFTAFSKAIGSGQMTLGIWNNQLKTSGLTNSERFRQSLIDAAEAAGTLIRKGNELYTLDGKFTVGINNITDSFKSGWATTEVMLKALDSYSNTVDAVFALTNDGRIDITAKAFNSLREAMEKQGKTLKDLKLDENFSTASDAINTLKNAYISLGIEVPKSLNAFSRSQEAISFTQAVESIQTTVASQWAKTFELIFGNYEEAKELWTTLANEMWEWFASGADERNSILEKWHEGFTRFSLAEDVGEITKSSELLEEYTNKIEKLNKGDILNNSIDYKKTSLKVFNALLSRDINDIGDAITSTFDKYGSLDKLPDMFSIDEYNIIKGMVDERGKLLEITEDEAEQSKIIAEYNKKIGEYVKTTSTYKNPFMYFDIEGATSTKLLEVMEAYKEAIKTDDTATMLSLWKQNGSEMASSFVKIKDIRDIWSQIEEINSNDTLTLKQKNELTADLYSDLVDLTKQYSDLGLIEELSQHQKVLTDFFDAVNNADAESVLKIWKEDSELILNNMDELPKKVYDLSNQINDLDSSDVINNRIKRWNDYIGVANRDSSEIGRIWLEQNKTILNVSVESKKLAELDAARLKALESATTELQKQNIEAEYNKKIGDELLNSGIYSELYKVGELSIQMNSNALKYVNILESVQSALKVGDHQKIADIWKQNKDAMLEIFARTEQYKQIKDIYKEIDLINNNIYDTEDERNWLLDSQYEKLAKITSEMSNLDEIAELQKELDEEIVDYFTNANKGYDTFVEGIKTGLGIITSMLETIREAWKTVFPPIKATALIDATERFKNFMETLVPTEEKLEEIKGILVGFIYPLKAIIAVGETIFKSFIQPLADRFKPIFSDIYDIIKNIGEILQNTSKSAIDNMSPLEKILKGILDILDPIINGISKFVKWIKELTSQNSEITIFSGLFQTIGNIFEHVGKAVKGTANLFSDVAKSLGTIFDKLKETLGNLLSSHGSDVAGLAEGGFLGVLAYGMATAVGKLKNLKLDDIFNSILNIFNKDKGPGLIDKIKETFETLTNSVKTFTESIKVKLIETIGNALIKLAAALLIISLIDSDKMASSLGMVMGVLGEALAFMGIASQLDSKNMTVATKALSKLGFALLELSVALKIMSGLDPAGMITSLSTMGIVLLELGLFFKALSKMESDPKTIQSISKTMASLGFAMIEIAAALKIMSTISGDNMPTAILGMTASLAAIGVFIVAINKFTKDAGPAKIAAISASLTLMGFGLIELAAAMKIMSTMNFSSMVISLAALGGALAAIGLFAKLLSADDGGLGFVAISAGMLLMSTAIAAMSVSLIALGAVGWGTIGPALGMLASGLAIIGIEGAALGIVSPLLLLFAIALGAFGLALKTTAAGISEFVAAYALFSAVGEDLSQNLMTIFEQAFASIIELIPTLILGIIQAVFNVAGELVNLIGQLIDIVLTALIENVPKLIEGGFTLLISILQGIRDHIYEVITVAVEIIVQLAQALGDNLPILIDAGFKLIINLINGLANSIRENAGELGAAFGNLAEAILQGIVEGLFSAVTSFGGKLLDFGKGIVDGIKSWFDGSQSTRDNNQSGEKIVTDIGTGVDNESPHLANKVEDLGKTTTETYQKGYESLVPDLLKSVTDTGKQITTEMDVSEDAQTSGESTLSGLHTGLTSESWLSQIAAAGKNAGRRFMDAYNSELDIHSPSREMAKSGKFTIQGLIQGLKDSEGIENTAREVGTMVLNSIQEAIEAANSILDDDLNPVITPILDLSNINSNAGYISGLFGANSTYNSAMAVGALGSYGINQNGEKNPININIDFSIDNSGKDITDADISRWGKQISNEVNIQLGRLLGG